MNCSSLLGAQSHLLSRRQALQGASAVALSSALCGCPLFVKRLQPICPENIDPNAPAKQLAIDVHTHLFNASDLQVSQFLSRVVSHQKTGGMANLARYLGVVLQQVYWDGAPSGQREREQLLTLQLSDCKGE